MNNCCNLKNAFVLESRGDFKNAYILFNNEAIRLSNNEADFQRCNLDDMHILRWAFAILYSVDYGFTEYYEINVTDDPIKLGFAVLDLLNNNNFEKKIWKMYFENLAWGEEFSIKNYSKDEIMKPLFQLIVYNSHEHNDEIVKQYGAENSIMWMVIKSYL